jgi:hypothetical protein
VNFINFKDNIKTVFWEGCRFFLETQEQGFILNGKSLYWLYLNLAYYIDDLLLLESKAALKNKPAFGSTSGECEPETAAWHDSGKGKIKTADKCFHSRRSH